MKWEAKRAIGCRNVFAQCQKRALSALLAVPGFLRTHPQNYQDSAHLIPTFTECMDVVIDFRKDPRGVSYDTSFRIQGPSWASGRVVFSIIRNRNLSNS